MLNLLQRDDLPSQTLTEGIILKNFVTISNHNRLIFKVETI